MNVKVVLVGAKTPNSDLERCKEILIDYPGCAFGGLSEYLIRGMDSEERTIYLGEQGSVKFSILIAVNGIMIWDKDRDNLHLKEGDQIELIVPPG